MNEFSTLVDVLRWRAEHQPDRCAYTFLPDGETEEVNLTYGQFDQQARAVAAQLQQQGLTGQQALLIFPAGLENAIALLGCMYAGVVPVLTFPPRPGRPLTPLQNAATDARAAVVLTTAKMVPGLQQMFEPAPELSRLPFIAVDQLEAGITAADWCMPALKGDDLALLSYTSGSTSAPKGVMINHQALAQDLPQIGRGFNLDFDRNAVFWLAWHHIAGAVLGLFAVIPGMRLVVMPTESFLERPARWLETISRYQASLTVAFNFAFPLALTRITPQEREQFDLKPLDYLMVGGERVDAHLLDKFAETFAPCGFQRKCLRPVYGISESSGIGAGFPGPQGLRYFWAKRSGLEERQVIPAEPGDDTAVTIVGCGEAMPGKPITIVDPETRTRCVPGQIGEIWLSGPTVAMGYWNKPQETEYTFRAYLADTGEGPFLRTGDLGFVEDGELYITGRVKELIIIRGRNYYPQDFEQTVERSHPALMPGGGAAFAVPDEGSEALVIIHEVRPDYPNLNVDEITKAMREAVAQEQEQPIHTILLVRAGSLPRTSTGKIQRLVCRAQFLEEREAVPKPA